MHVKTEARKAEKAARGNITHRKHAGTLYNIKILMKVMKYRAMYGLNTITETTLK